MNNSYSSPEKTKQRVRRNLFVRTTKSLSSFASSLSSPKRGKAVSEAKAESTPPGSCRKEVLSLGVGSFSSDGKSVSFSPSPTKKDVLKAQDLFRSISSSTSSEAETSDSTASSRSEIVFVRQRSSFLRVADLDMDDETAYSVSGVGDDDPIGGVVIVDEEQSHPNFHHASVDPPPGVEHDPNELWVALNDGGENSLDGSSIHSATPIAPIAVQRLVKFGLETALDKSMWTPDSKRGKIGQLQWVQDTFQRTGCIRLSLSEQKKVDDVMIWSGSFRHGKYGSDLPAIRAAGFVNMSAKALMELMVDSTRVKEYNLLSLGRVDLVRFQDDMETKGPFGHSITKVMKSETRPPMLRKTLVFVSMLHAQELPDGSGYLIVTRAVETPEDDEKNNANILKSEILMGVNLIRKVEGFEDRCVMINVNHIRSPMVPTMIAKRIGVSAAVSFITDIRAVGS